MTNRHPLWLAVLLVASACKGTGASAPPPGEQPPAAEATPAPAPAPAAQQAPAPAPAAKVEEDPRGGNDPQREEALAKAFAPFFDAFVNTDGAYTRDGRQVVFVSNRDGLPQLYVADARAPAAAPRRLTRTTERVTDALPLPDGKTALLRMDEGADENWRVYRVELASGQLTELTPGEKLQRDNPMVPEDAPDAAFFSARKMEEKASTLYRLPLSGGGKPEAVYQDPDSGFLADVSRDGKAALWLRLHASSDIELLHVDLGTGEARKLYPTGDQKVAVHDARFTPDGQRVLFVTDAGGEQALVLALSAADGREVARYVETKPATAELAGLEVAPRGGTVAVNVNAGNRRELRLLDERTLRPRARVQLPLGFGYPNRFSQDGQHLPVTWSSPGKPTDVYDVDVRSGRVTPLRRDVRPGLASLPPVEASIQEITAHDGLEVPINVYLPKGGAKGGKRMPVIVSYHGGPSSSYAVRWSPPIGFFLSQGYAWVEPNVRGSTGFGRAYEMGDDGPKRFEAFKDIEATARWAASQPWADPERMVVYGGSYGGYTTLITLERNPDIWRAGVNLFGVANMRTFLESTSGVIRDIFRVEFGELGRDDALLEQLSPLAQVDKIVDPLFVYAGANDPRVPLSESNQIVAALRARKVPVEYMVAENEGHSLARRENQIEAQSRIARFLEEHAGPGAASAR